MPSKKRKSSSKKRSLEDDEGLPFHFSADLTEPIIVNEPLVDDDGDMDRSMSLRRCVWNIFKMRSSVSFRFTHAPLLSPFLP